MVIIMFTDDYLRFLTTHFNDENIFLNQTSGDCAIATVGKRRELLPLIIVVG